jgi:hypothetical protein
VSLPFRFSPRMNIIPIVLFSFLYILGSNATQVQVMSLAAPGKAASIQNVDISAPAKRAGLPVNGFNLQGMTTFIKA